MELEYRPNPRLLQEASWKLLAGMYFGLAPYGNPADKTIKVGNGSFHMAMVRLAQLKLVSEIESHILSQVNGPAFTAALLEFMTKTIGSAKLDDSGSLMRLTLSQNSASYLLTIISGHPAPDQLATVGIELIRELDRINGQPT